MNNRRRPTAEVFRSSENSATSDVLQNRVDRSTQVADALPVNDSQRQDACAFALRRDNRRTISYFARLQRCCKSSTPSIGNSIGSSMKHLNHESN